MCVSLSPHKEIEVINNSESHPYLRYVEFHFDLTTSVVDRVLTRISRNLLYLSFCTVLSAKSWVLPDTVKCHT